MASLAKCNVSQGHDPRSHEPLSHHCGREKEDEVVSDAEEASGQGDTAIDGAYNRVAGLEFASRARKWWESQ
jgi:hypothetical protein